MMTTQTTNEILTATGGSVGTLIILFIIRLLSRKYCKSRCCGYNIEWESSSNSDRHIDDGDETTP